MSLPPSRPGYSQEHPAYSFPPPASHLSSPSFAQSAPPPPPPKPPTHHSPNLNTTFQQTGPPLPQPPSDSYSNYNPTNLYQQPPNGTPPNTGPQALRLDDGWLPEIVKDKSTADLTELLHSPALLSALASTHPSHALSVQPLSNLLAQNTQLSTHLTSLSQSLARQRHETSAQLLRMHALERQWRLKQSALDDALAPFSPKALHGRLVASIGEQEDVLSGMEESFMDGEGRAGERELEGFLKRWREGRRVLEVRRERRGRWEEGRVGGWR